MEDLFFENFRGLNKSWDSFVQQRAVLLFHVLLFVFEPVPTKNAVISKLFIEDAPISHCSVCFLNHLMQGIRSKIAQKTAEKDKKT